MIFYLIVLFLLAVTVIFIQIQPYRVKKQMFFGALVAVSVGSSALLMYKGSYVGYATSDHSKHPLDEPVTSEYSPQYLEQFPSLKNTISTVSIDKQSMCSGDTVNSIEHCSLEPGNNSTIVVDCKDGIMLDPDASHTLTEDHCYSELETECTETGSFNSPSQKISVPRL
jgi:hypothetical protein